MLAFAAALVFHVFLMILCAVLRKVFHMTDVELGSVVYSNAGNLIIPIVTGVLGPEWVVYSSAFLVVQLVFIWTHGKLLFTADEKIQPAKILLNPSMIAVYIGFFLMFSGVRFPWEARRVRRQGRRILLRGRRRNQARKRFRQ